jgi:regulator-associated protein of mTOR
MDHFSVLNPKNVKQTLSKDGFEAPVDLFGFQDDDKENEAAITAEATSRKKELYFNESCLLSSRVCESKRTSVLRFHLCEPILASCDENNNLTIWDVSSVGRRLQSFQNSNQADSRITSLSWINELSNSLLLTGCDDGSIRLWSGVLDDYTGNSFERPTLANSFFAMPELHPGQKGSGLVTEWQQSHGRLIVGGDCPRIRCWDIEAEKCRNIIESDMNACLTSITSTWDSFQLSTQYRADGSSGLGPDIIVAGYSDGTIRAYDLRIPNACPVSEIKSDPRSRLRERWMKQVRFAEHSNWVVNVSFRKCGSRHEVTLFLVECFVISSDSCSHYLLISVQIVSGSTAGDIKFWDLRLPNSIRTLEIQRSPMTALACHTSIPLLASGSQAQFIKLMTPDGDITQVIRYHEKVSNQMIGPVSCLTFHPTQPLLAVGSTDEYIGLYKANISY